MSKLKVTDGTEYTDKAAESLVYLHQIGSLDTQHHGIITALLKRGVIDQTKRGRISIKERGRRHARQLKELGVQSASAASVHYVAYKGEYTT